MGPGALEEEKRRMQEEARRAQAGMSKGVMDQAMADFKSGLPGQVNATAHDNMQDAAPKPEDAAPKEGEGFNWGQAASALGNLQGKEVEAPPLQNLQGTFTPLAQQQPVVAGNPTGLMDMLKKIYGG